LTEVVGLENTQNLILITGSAVSPLALLYHHDCSSSYSGICRRTPNHRSLQDFIQELPTLSLQFSLQKHVPSSVECLCFSSWQAGSPTLPPWPEFSLVLRFQWAWCVLRTPRVLQDADTIQTPMAVFNPRILLMRPAWKHG